MLKTLTIAILLGLTSGRPSDDSGPEINISASKIVNYVNQELANAKENFIAQLEETPDQKLPYESLLRNRRASDSSAMNNAGTSGASLPSFLQVPLQGIVTVLSTVVFTLLKTIFALLSGILNPILVLLTGVLNPVLLPLRPVLNPILLPLNGLLADILKALNLSLSLSGLLTGNITNTALIPSLLTRATRSTNSEPSSDADGSSIAMSNALTTLVSKLRSKRQAPGTSTGSEVNSTTSSPLTLVENIITEAMNIMIVTPLESILSPIFSLLSIPIDLISEPLDLVQWLLSKVLSLLSGIIGEILPDGITSMLTPMLSEPSTPADTVPNATAIPSRQIRSDTNSELAGPLSAVLTILFSPLKILFSFLPSLLGHFNISYSTLQEAARALFSKAAKSFFTMACNQMKNFILPGLDDLLQSIVGSEYIPDYINSLIAQLHTVYKLLKMMGFLRPS